MKYLMKYSWIISSMLFGGYLVYIGYPITTKEYWILNGLLMLNVSSFQLKG